jgi:hypothetical protein
MAPHHRTRNLRTGLCIAQVGVFSLVMKPHDETKIASSTNDYYPFLVNAAAKLEQNTAESRRMAYERARAELVAGLRQIGLRISESEIACECRAFDAAIQRVQAELIGAQA